METIQGQTFAMMKWDLVSGKYGSTDRQIMHKLHCAAILAHPTQSDKDLCLRAYIRIYTAGILKYANVG